MFDFESKLKRDGYSFVIGVDEAGRGPLAGPVVAAAVLLKHPSLDARIADSKKLSKQMREKAFVEICNKAFIGLGIINEYVIDQHNILQATFIAMSTAVRQLISKLPQEKIKTADFHQKVHLLIDGNRFISELPYKYATVVQGDANVLSIACASIIAKVTRDRILNAYDKVFPQYGFGHHKGYPTKAHKQALERFGPSMIHRRTFKTVASLVDK